MKSNKTEKLKAKKDTFLYKI